MSIQEAVKAVYKQQKSTGGSAIGVVRKLWAKLSLSDSDIETLAQQALAGRVSAFATGGHLADKEESTSSYREPYRPPPQTNSPSEPRIHTSVVIERPPVKVIDVTVSVLYNTNYDINGHRKAFIEFTLSDLNYSINRYGQQIEGHQRHLAVMQYTKERLNKLGKKSVSELAQGEQTILARKLKAAVNGQQEAAA